MTQREFFNAVIEMANSTDDAKVFGSIHANGADIAVKASEMLATLDGANERKKAKNNEVKAETAHRRENVLATLTTDPVLPDTIAEKLGLTKGQVVSALTTLVKEGKAEKVVVKLADKTKKTAYSLAESAVGSDE